MIHTFSGAINKEQFLKEITKHRKADALVQGHYGQENGQWRGCAVACSLRSISVIKGEELHEWYDDHARYETELGIPEWLARVEDTIFEGLPVDDAKKWPERFTKAIAVGITAEQLEDVKWQFTSALMQENIERVETLDISDDLKKQVINALKLAKALKATSTVEERTAAESVARSARSAAESVAWSARSARSAAESVARSARSARSATRSATWSAAESVAWSARSAESVARSATWSAAESVAYMRYADVLIGLLQETKPMEEA